MSKCDIRPELYDKIGVRMSKCDIRPEFECQNRISNVKIRYMLYSARTRIFQPKHVTESQSQN